MLFGLPFIVFLTMYGVVSLDTILNDLKWNSKMHTEI